MTAHLQFVVGGQPVPKARARAAWRGGGRHYTPEKTRAYEQSIAAHAKATSVLRGNWNKSGDYHVTMDVYFADRRRRDLDNVLKSVLDACNGVLWKDDYQVSSFHVRRQFDKAYPRIEVSVLNVAGTRAEAA